jgi:hypothetical protein
MNNFRTMEVRPDPACLPDDKQEIQFQIVIEEINGKWRTGIYNDIEQAIYESIVDENGELVTITHCISAEVVRWEPKDRLPGDQWNNLSKKDADKINSLIRIHNKGQKPN